MPSSAAASFCTNQCGGAPHFGRQLRHRPALAIGQAEVAFDQWPERASKCREKCQASAGRSRSGGSPSDDGSDDLLLADARTMPKNIAQDAHLSTLLRVCEISSRTARASIVPEIRGPRTGGSRRRTPVRRGQPEGEGRGDSVLAALAALERVALALLA